MEYTMKEPKVITALAVNAATTTLVVLRNDGGGVLNKISWDFRDIEREGYDGVCLKLGNAVLRMLAAAHPAEFAAYPLLLPPPPLPGEELPDLVQALIAQSVHDRTRDYVEAIDALLARHPGAFAHISLPDDWASIRQGVMHNFD
jgi:hypothetical protein